MATYYVSAQRGVDTNNGTSSSTPWATITKAVGEVAAGDTVYIGPGTYREKPNLSTPGTSGNIINWIPDPQVKYVTGDDPGIVRITGCGVDELPTEGDVWDGQQDYNTLGDPDGGFGQVWIDGSSDGHTVRFEHEGTENGYGVVSHGKYGFRSGTYTNCIGVGGYMGFYYADATNCIAVSGHYGYHQGNLMNCIGIGGSVGINPVTATNCIAVGGENGFEQGTLTNCIAVGANNGFIGRPADTTLTKCRSIACRYAFWGTVADVDVSDLSYVWCVYATGGESATGTPSEAKAVIYDMTRLAEALKPLLQFNLNDGDNTVSAGDYDILGLARRLGDGTIDIGPIEHSHIEPEFTNMKTVTPALKIERAGMERFTFWAEGGVEFTKTVWVKWASYAGADKPRLIADGTQVTRTTATATGDGADWEQLSVSATPTADGEVMLYLYARDVDASAVTYFSDLE